MTIPDSSVGTFPTLPSDGVCTAVPAQGQLQGPMGNPQAVADAYDGGLLYTLPENTTKTPTLGLNDAQVQNLEILWSASAELKSVLDGGAVTYVDLSGNSNVKLPGMTATEASSVGRGYVFKVDDHYFIAFDFTDAQGRQTFYVQPYTGNSDIIQPPALVWSENSARFPLSNGGRFEVAMTVNIAGKQNAVAMYYPPDLSQAIDVAAPVVSATEGSAFVMIGGEHSVIGMGDQVPILETGVSETSVTYNGQKWVLHGRNGAISVWNDMNGGAISPDHGKPLITKYGSAGIAQEHPFYVASDGKVYFSPDNVMRLLLEELDAHQSAPAVESSAAHPAAAAAGVSLSHIGMSAAGGVAGGLIGLGIVEGCEAMTGEEMGAAGEFAAYTASGVGTGLATSALAGQAVTAGALLPSFVTGAAAGVPIFAGVAVSEEMIGVDSTSVEGQAGAIVVGSGLAAAAPFATVGGTSAAAAGFTATGVGLAAVSGVAVGGSLVAGVGIGIGVDHAAGAVINSDGDGTLSGWMAEDEWNAATVAGTVIAGPVAGLAIYGLGKLVHHFQSSDPQ